MIPDWTDKLVGFDLETTGVDTDTDRIVSAAVVDFDDGERVDAVEWAVDPGIPIPEEATVVHGVSESERIGRQPHGEAVLEIVEELGDAWRAGYTVVVFNAPFDFTLLQTRAREAGAEFTVGGKVVDPMVVDRYLDPYRKGRRTLEAMSGHYGVTLEDAHNATADADAAVRLALAVAERWPEELSEATLMERQAQWSAENEEGLRAWLRKQGKPTGDLRSGWPIRDPR